MSQASATLSASSLENLSAVSSCHSLSESVNLTSLSLLGLICSKHTYTSDFYFNFKLLTNSQIGTSYYNINHTVLSTGIFIFIMWILYENQWFGVFRWKMICFTPAQASWVPSKVPTRKDETSELLPNVKWNKSPHARRHFTRRRRISRTECISQIPQGIYFIENKKYPAVYHCPVVIVGFTLNSPLQC